MEPGKLTIRIYSREMKTILLHKTLYLNAHNSIRCNCLKLEATQISLHGWKKHTWLSTFAPWTAAQQYKSMNYWYTQQLNGLQCIFLNEITQSLEVTYCIIPFLWHSRGDKTIETEKKLMLPRDEGWESQNKKGTLWRNVLAMLTFFCILSVGDGYKNLHYK